MILNRPMVEVFLEKAREEGEDIIAALCEAYLAQHGTESDPGIACSRALNRLLRECVWSASGG